MYTSCLRLRGLSREINLAFDDMYGYIYAEIGVGVIAPMIL